MTKEKVKEDIFINTVGVCDGVYVEISIFDLDVNCLVDTGSSRTIISRDISHQISLKNKRLATCTIDVSLLSLRLADGTPLDCSVGIIVPVRIGKVVVKQTVLVANISDHATLELDFVRSHGCLIDLYTQEFEVKVQLRQLQWQTCLVHLDDVIVFSSDFQEHVHHLREVLLRIKSAGLKLKPAKCHFFRKQVAFLGHVVSDDGIATDPEKIQAVVSWPPPTSVTQVRAYPGFCSYYRRFIPNFSQIALPLS